METRGEERGGDCVVWVDAWQQDCCGDHWAIGSSVSWTVEPPNREYLDPLFAPGAGVTIDWHEERHDESRAGLRTLAGTIVAIAGVDLDYEARDPDEPKMMYPVAGSARLAPLTKSEGDELRRDNFTGYVVTLRP